jgi:hypothetical protein
VRSLTRVSEGSRPIDRARGGALGFYSGWGCSRWLVPLDPVVHRGINKRRQFCAVVVWWCLAAA